MDHLLHAYYDSSDDDNDYIDHHASRADAAKATNPASSQTLINNNDQHDDDDKMLQKKLLFDDAGPAAASPKKMPCCNTRQKPSLNEKDGFLQIQPKTKRLLTAATVRSVPHIRGNWAGHVFLPVQWDDDDDDDHLLAKRAIQKSVQQFKRMLRKKSMASCLTELSASEYENDDDDDDDDDNNALHISLSRTFYLQMGSIDSFIKDLASRVSFEFEFEIWLDLRNCTVLLNDEQTRSFWTLPLVLLMQPQPQQQLQIQQIQQTCYSPPFSNLVRLVQQVDQVLQKFQQPTYYNPPIFHISLASCAGNVLAEQPLISGEHQDCCGDNATKKTEREQKHIIHNNQPRRDNDCHQNKKRQRVVIGDHNDSLSNSVDDDSDDLDDDSDDDELPLILRAHINSIHCTFGTTKSYVIPLKKAG